MQIHTATISPQLHKEASVAQCSSHQRIEPAALRYNILAQSRRANVGHIGSCLSVVEILAALYDGVLRSVSPEDLDRHRFVLSKGHAALALYAVLVLNGWISESVLDTFCGENSLLGVHPDAALRGVDFSTGSLGHGPSIAAGAALAARLQFSNRRVYCLISDAECNEGAVWEAAMFAAHHRLDNLTLILDWNGQQALGRTCDVLDCSNLQQRWEAFGWRATEVDGHSVPALKHALEFQHPAQDPKPNIVLAKTTFGKGVSYMEQGVPLAQTNLPVQTINWHYLPMSAEEYEIALAELKGCG